MSLLSEEVTPLLGILWALGDPSSSPDLPPILDVGPLACSGQGCLEEGLNRSPGFLFDVSVLATRWRRAAMGWSGSRYHSALLFVFLVVTPVYKELVLLVSSTL